MVTTKSKKKAWFKASGPILIVDDDSDDANLTKRTIDLLRPDVPVQIIGSGKSLVAFLEGESAYSDPITHPLPSVILLDLIMPEMDGFAVLEWIGRQPKFATIPVIVLTAYPDLPHLNRAYALSARAFLVKPINLPSFRDTLASLNLTV